MRRSSLSLYAPFLALALVQALLVAVAPSTGPDRQAVSALGPNAGGPRGTGGGTFDPETGQFIGEDGVAIDAGGNGGGAGGAGGQGGGGQGGGGGGGGGAAAGEGDTSHCTPEGRQMNVMAYPFENVECIPKWPEGADNGGETYRGVKGDEVKVVYFETRPNEAVNAVLRPQGLAATDGDLENVRTAAEKFINKYYETYGRNVKLVRFKSDCPTSPPDVPTCKAEARRLMEQENPFIVIFGLGLYPTVFDEFARAGVLTLGGWHFSEEYFTQRRPYRYDVFMDGSASARIIGEYYCKKLAGKPATNAGEMIHPTIGGRDTKRKLGIVVPEVEANVNTAKLVQSIVRDCEGGAYSPPIFTYVSDIDRAAEQTQATTSGLIDAKVTTVVCMCDPVAPAFGTKGYTANRYYPENLLPGLGLLDHDKLGRLYDPEQWNHAFGPSHLPNSRPFGDEQISRVFADQQMGEPCGSCNLPWVYWGLAGAMIHYAGPNLNPLTVEQALLTRPGYGGWDQNQDGRTVLVQFGENDYTAISDVREAYWDAGHRSDVDGQPGGYVPMDGGRRYTEGGIPAAFAVPAKPQ